MVHPDALDMFGWLYKHVRAFICIVRTVLTLSERFFAIIMHSFNRLSPA